MYTSQFQVKSCNILIIVSTGIALLDYVTNLQSSKPVIIGGDMSVAYQPIDLAEPTEDHHKAGFTNKNELILVNYLMLA